MDLYNIVQLWVDYIVAYIFYNHLKFSRSHEYDPQYEDLGGKNFVLFAIMTDVDQDIVIGSDGIEHL